MKTQQQWHSPDAYEFIQELHPRLLDVNPGRHVSNIALLRYFLQARMQFRRQALDWRSRNAPNLMLRPAGTKTDFLNMAFYPAPITAGVALTAIGDSHFRLQCALFQNTHCVALQACDIAAWQGGSQVILPDALAARLQKYDLTSEPFEPQTPPQRGTTPFQVRITARYGDLDAEGCVSEAALAEYADHVRSTLVFNTFVKGGYELRRSPFSTLAASVRNRFYTHRTVRGDVLVEAGVIRLGNSSFEVRLAMFSGDTCLAVSDHVMVCIDRASDRPIRIPDGVRLHFEASQRESTLLGAL